MTRVTSADLAKLVGITPKVLQFFTNLFSATEEAKSTAADAAKTAVASTGAIQNATVLTLSANSAFDNERVLVLDTADFLIVDTGPNGQYRVSVKFPATPTLTVPGPFTDDADAEANGVDVGGVYKAPMGAVVWRQV